MDDALKAFVDEYATNLKKTEEINKQIEEAKRQSLELQVKTLQLSEENGTASAMIAAHEVTIQERREALKELEAKVNELEIFSSSVAQVRNRGKYAVRCF